MLCIVSFFVFLAFSYTPFIAVHQLISSRMNNESNEVKKTLSANIVTPFSTAFYRKALPLRFKLCLILFFVSLVPVLLKQQSREPWRQINWTCAVMNLHQRIRTVRSWKRVPRLTPAAFTSLTPMWCSFVCLLRQRSSCRQLSLWVIITATFVREWKKMKIFHAGTIEHSLDNKIAFVKVESKRVEFELVEMQCLKIKTRKE